MKASEMADIMEFLKEHGIMCACMKNGDGNLITMLCSGECAQKSGKYD